MEKSREEVLLRELKLVLQQDVAILPHLLAQGAINQSLFDELSCLPTEERAEKLVEEIYGLVSLNQKYYQMLLQYMNSKWEYGNIVKIFEGLPHGSQHLNPPAAQERNWNLLLQCLHVAVVCIIIYYLLRVDRLVKC